jgi:sirohydrochlorin ferrochelatase
MPDQIQPQRLRELRNMGLRYLQSNGASQPRGYVDVNNLQTYLETTPEEYRTMYMHFFNGGLARTNGSDSHMFLTKEDSRRGG